MAPAAAPDAGATRASITNGGGPPGAPPAVGRASAAREVPRRISTDSEEVAVAGRQSKALSDEGSDAEHGQDDDEKDDQLATVSKKGFNKGNKASLSFWEQERLRMEIAESQNEGMAVTPSMASTRSKKKGKLRKSFFAVMRNVKEAGRAAVEIIAPGQMKPEEEDPSDPDDFDDDPFKGQVQTAEELAAIRRKKLADEAVVNQLEPAEIEAIRQQFRDELGVPAPGEKAHWWVRFQMLTGIMAFRICILTKRRRVEHEKPPFPFAYQIVNKLKFEALVGVVIILNAINIGVDSMYKQGDPDRPAFINMFENVFTALFVCEYVLRIMAFSWVWIFTPMNFFDTFVVWVTGVLVTWVLVPAEVDTGLLQQMAALRVLRLGRIIRAIRIIPEFRELWVLVDGITGCMGLLFWASILIGVVHYIFAVFFMETVAKSPVFANNELVQEQLGNLLDAMFTLFQVMTFDQWNVIVREVTGQMPWTVVMWLLFEGIAGIVLFNLITAIVLNQAMVEAPKKDEEALARKKELESKKMVAKLRNIFEEIDQDQSGRVSREEFDDILKDVNFAKTMKALEMDLEELPDIFDILDDGSGEISVDGFITGLMRMQGPAMARDMLKGQKRLSLVSDHFFVSKGRLHERTLRPLEHIGEDLILMHEDFGKAQLLIAKCLRQLDEVGTRRMLKASVPDLPAIAEPTAEDLQNAENARARAATLAAAAMSVGGVVPMSPPSSPMSRRSVAFDKKGVHLRPLPVTWIAKKREEGRKVRTLLALRERQAQAEKTARDRKESRVLLDMLKPPGVHQELQAVWDQFGLSVARAPPPGLALRELAAAGAGGPPKPPIPPDCKIVQGLAWSLVEAPPGRGTVLPPTGPALCLPAEPPPHEQALSHWPPAPTPPRRSIKQTARELDLRNLLDPHLHHPHAPVHP